MRCGISGHLLLSWLIPHACCAACNKVNNLHELVSHLLVTNATPGPLISREPVWRGLVASMSALCVQELAGMSHTELAALLPAEHEWGRAGAAICLLGNLLEAGGPTLQVPCSGRLHLGLSLILFSEFD